MSLFVALALAASASQPSQPHTQVTASARATVVILSGAKISLSNAAQAEGYRLNDATITVEDGSRRPAKLVEFQ